MKKDAILELVPQNLLTDVLCDPVVQGSAKEWSIGCVKRAPAARVIRDMGITQPKDHYLADPCINGVLH